MGSLMAGWNSAAKDPKSAKYQRNKSLTREEIDAYWKSKMITPDEHITAVSVLGHENQENIHKAVSKKTVQRSSSFPLTDKKDSQNNDAKKDFNSNACWWTRSNMAFLNEPPVMVIEGPHKYASQYTVTNFGNSQATKKK